MVQQLTEEQRRTAMAGGAVQHFLINNPPTYTSSLAARYDIAPGTAPSYIQYSGTVSRTAVKFDTTGIGIDTIPKPITINYRRVGNISVGIRKAVGDTFQLMAQWPVTETKPGILTIVVEGANEYQMVADDKISIEYPPSETDTIEIACSTTESLPAGFTSQEYTGSYAATTNPIAVRIRTEVRTPI